MLSGSVFEDDRDALNGRFRASTDEGSRADWATARRYIATDAASLRSAQGGNALFEDRAG